MRCASSRVTSARSCALVISIVTSREIDSRLTSSPSRLCTGETTTSQCLGVPLAVGQSAENRATLPVQGAEVLDLHKTDAFGIHAQQPTIKAHRLDTVGAAVEQTVRAHGKSVRVAVG